MKHRNLIALASVLAGASLTQAPLALAQTPTPAPTTAPGDVKTNTVIPLDGQKVVFQGKTYTLSGALHVTFSVQQQKDGAFIKLHVNAQGAIVTAPDGTVYRLTGAGNAQARTEADGASFKVGANFGLIGQGQAPNGHLHVNLRGTVSNGKVTLTRSDVTLS